MMKHGRRWVQAVISFAGGAWPTDPSHHARPVTASPRATASTRGAACQRMMLDYPEPKRLYSQMMRGSPGMARMSREMMGSGAAA